MDPETRLNWYTLIFTYQGHTERAVCKAKSGQQAIRFFRHTRRKDLRRDKIVILSCDPGVNRG